MTANKEPGYLPFKVKAKFAYAPNDSNVNPSLSLIAGEVYDVTLTDNGAGLWWFGKDKSGREGWFPASYSEVLPGAQLPPNLPPSLPQQQQLMNQTYAQPQQNFQQQGGFRQNSQPSLGQGQGPYGQQGNQFGQQGNQFGQGGMGHNQGFGQGQGGGQMRAAIQEQIRQQIMQNQEQKGQQQQQMQQYMQQSLQNSGNGQLGGGGFFQNLMQGLAQQQQNGQFNQQQFTNTLLPGLQRPKFGAQLTLDQKREFIDRGFLIVRNVIPKEILNRALRAINRCVASPTQDNIPVPKEISSVPELMTSKVLADLLNATPAYEYADQLIGEANHVRGCQIALRYPGHGCTKANMKKLGLDGAIANLGNANPLIGGVINQFLGNDDEDSFYTYPEGWDKHWHIDGFPDAIKQLQTGVVKNFTMLLGIYLSDASEPFRGNLCCHPGSHRQLEEYFQEKGGVLKFVDGTFDGIRVVHEDMTSRLAPTEQILVNAGDIVLAHYQTAHSIAPNVGPNVRYCVYFRLHHASHEIDGGKPECLTNIWCDYDGIRDLAHQMYPPRK